MKHRLMLGDEREEERPARHECTSIWSSLLGVPNRTPSVSEGPRKYAGAGAGRSLTLPVLSGGLGP